MAKFSGLIGYSQTIEKAPGVWVEELVEKHYTGDFIKNTSQWQNGENLNDDLRINQVISIVADSFAYENLYLMRYIRWAGASWKITNIDPQRPRIILTIGGLYNGEKT